MSGFPAYIRHDDTFLDLRERYPKYLEDFRKTFNIPEDKLLTFVIDRGIYKQAFFKENLKTNNRIITWEKDYDKGQFEESKISGQYQSFWCCHA